MDWESILLPNTPLIEIIFRGSVMYLSLFCLLRFVLKRQAGTIAISDLLLVVLIADAAQNGMADDYRSVTDGIVLVATIIFWNFVLDWLGYRFPHIQRLVHPPPLPIVKDGRILYGQMKKELLTEEELRSQLRSQGIERVEEIKEAFVEGNGQISIIKKSKEPQQQKSSKRKM